MEDYVKIGAAFLQGYVGIALAIVIFGCVAAADKLDKFKYRIVSKNKSDWWITGFASVLIFACIAAQFVK